MDCIRRIVSAVSPPAQDPPHVCVRMMDWVKSSFGPVSDGGRGEPIEVALGRRIADTGDGGSATVEAVACTPYASGGRRKRILA